MRLTPGCPLLNPLPHAGEEANEKCAVKSLMRLATLLLLLGVSHASYAFDFISVAEPAILYDANSLKARKLFVATRYLPLEQVVVLDNWVKVRDNAGRLFWIEKRQVSSKRYVMVTVPSASVRRSPDEGAELVFKAKQQLGLEWLGNSGNGWVKVRHADGSMGYLKSNDVWGD